MHLNKICTEKHEADEDLKTQLRFGRNDVEVYTKRKSENQGFWLVNLSDFTDI